MNVRGLKKFFRNTTDALEADLRDACCEDCEAEIKKVLAAYRKVLGSFL